MDLGSIERLLLDFLKDRRSVGGYDLRSWYALVAALKKYGILGVYSKLLVECAPPPIMRELSVWSNGHARAMARRMSLLCDIAEQAGEESLRILLIKGMGLSETAYGDPYARQSGDIDLLVAADDIPKADFVMRSLGWHQPGEARLVRALGSSAALTEVRLRELESPYPLRSNVILPHVTNYYKREAGELETVEVHDRFHCLTSEQTAGFLWDGECRTLSGTPIATPGYPIALVISALSLHEDAETAIANTSTRGTMGFKTCIDVHFLLGKMSADDLEKCSRYIHCLGVEDEVGTALADVLEVFPSDEAVLSRLVSTSKMSPWSKSYIDRVFNPQERAKAAVLDIATALVECPGTDSGAFLALEPGGLPLKNVNGIGDSLFTFEVEQSDVTRLKWSFPRGIADSLEDLVFQCVAIFLGDPGEIGIRLNIFLDAGRWMASCQAIGADTVDGHANKISRGRQPMEAVFHDDGGIATVSIGLQKGGYAGLCPSVWSRVYGQLHRRIAGEDFGDTVKRMMEGRNG